MASPDCYKDCADLRSAFGVRGVGCDAKTIIEILGQRTYAQINAIKIAYTNLFNEDLVQRLESKLHRNFKKTMLLWMRDYTARDAAILQQCLKSWKMNIGALVEIICLRSHNELNDIARQYLGTYGSTLQRDIESTTKDSMRLIFLRYLEGVRDENNVVDVQDFAKKLYEAGEGGEHFDELKVASLFSSCTPGQICSVLEAYKQLYGHEILEYLKEKPGDFSDILQTIIECIKYPTMYFAKVLFKSMHGLGTDDSTLIRVVVSRAEIDMDDIKTHFVRKYKKSLEDMITSDTSGNYRSFLLTLIRQKSN